MVNLTPWRDRGRGEASEASPVQRLRSEVERLFDRFFEPSLFGGSMRAGGEWSPSIEIFDEGSELVVAAEVPGMQPDDIEISLSGNHLTICGEKRESREQEQRGVFYSERRFGMFRRVIELPQEIEADQVNAEYDSGVLTVHLPKSQAQRPTRVQVKAGSGRQRAAEAGHAGHFAARGAEPRASQAGAPGRSSNQPGAVGPRSQRNRRETIDDAGA